MAFCFLLYIVTFVVFPLPVLYAAMRTYVWLMVVKILLLAVSKLQCLQTITVIGTPGFWHHH